METAKAVYFTLSARVAGGAIVRCSLEEHIKYSLRAAILVQQGELLHHPQVGSRARGFLFRPLTANLKSDLRAEVARAIQKSEPRVELLETELASDPTEKSRILVQLKYRIRETRRLDQLRVSLQA